MSEKLRMNWTINGLLSVILVLLVGNYVQNFASKSAHAAGGGWDTDGVMVLTTSGPQERLVLVDTTKKNIMIYHPQNGGLFGLSGARSYRYDVEMEDSGKGFGNGLTWQQTKALYDMAKNNGPK